MPVTVYTTASSQIRWHNLETWLAGYKAVLGRRGSSHNHQVAKNHVRHLNDERGWIIPACACQKTLREVREQLLKANPADGGVPARGYRSDHMTTPLIMDLNNRVRQLEREEDFASMGRGHNSQGRSDD